MPIGFDEWAVIQRLHDGSGRFQLMRNLIYRTEAGNMYVVPRGFKTDLATIPKIFWGILPPHDLYLSAAILHDYFCVNNWIKRKDIDKLFLEAMKWSNIPKWKRYVVYLSVRLYSITHIIK